MAAKFWVGGTGNWDASDTTHWSATTGGAGGDAVPGAADDVTFDASSGGGVVTITATQSVNSITGGAHTGTVDFNGQTVTSKTISWSGTGVRTLTLGAATINLTATSVSNFWDLTTTTNLTFSGASATFVIGSYAFTRTWIGGGKTYGTLTYTVAGSAGQLNLKGTNTFTTLNFSDTNNARTLQFDGSNTITVTNFNVNGTVGKLMTITNGSGTTTLSKASGIVVCDYLSITRQSAGGGATWYAGSHSTNVTGNSGWIFTDPPTVTTKSTKGVSLINISRLK